MKSKNNMITQFFTYLACFGLLVLVSCGDDEPMPDAMPTGDDAEFALSEFDGSGISGKAIFELLDDKSVRITLELTGTTSGVNHPSHIHVNTAAESGAIALTLTDVDGATGKSVTIASKLDDGSVLTFAQMMDFDGYINIHKSASDLATTVTQGDIGQNELTGASKEFALASVSEPAISGKATFYERVNDEALVVIELDGDASNSDRPAHIHDNTAAEGGDVAFALTNVMNGWSKTNISTATYTDLLSYDGYINVHKSGAEVAVLVAQGDIGQNELTGTSKEFALAAVSDPAISGKATFYERVNDEALVVIELDGDATDSDRPAHIHDNTAAEGGDVAFALTSVMNGWSKTNISTATYTELLSYDGYINVHKSGAEVAVLVAQGDIGQNELTGTSKEYALATVSNPEISGKATFYERVNEEALVVIELDGDAMDSDRPAHIHDNTAAEGGGVAFGLTNVMNGWSKTNISTATYTELLSYDGYINVHKSGAEVAVLVAQGDIGQNELTGNSRSYSLNAVSNQSIFGNVKFEERVNGEVLVTISLEGTSQGGDHPAHIHENSAATGGGIAITLSSVNGETGISKTNVKALNNETAIDYDGLLTFDGYINVHNSSTDLETLIAQGDIGSNVN